MGTGGAVEGWVEEFHPLGLVVAVGAAARFFRIGAEDLWLDEVSSVVYVRDYSAFAIAFELPFSDPHPPLYYLVLSAWTEVFGTSATAVRSFSAAASVATLPVVYLLARRLFDERVALVATLLMAVDAFHVYYAQEARMYSLLYFLSTLSMLAFLRLSDGVTPASSGLYVGATVAAAFTHVYGLFVLAAQNLVWLVNAVRGERADFEVPVRVWVGLQAVTAAALSPWLYVLAVRAVGDTPGWIATPGPLDVLVTFGRYLAGKTLTHLVGGSGTTFTLVTTAGVAALFVVMVGLGFVRPNWPGSLHRRGAGRLFDRNGREALFVLVAWVAAVVVVPFVVSYLVSPVYRPRYTGAASVPVLVLAAKGVVSCEYRHVRAISLALAVLGLSALTGVYYTETVKGEWSEVTADVDGAATGEDLVLLTPDYMRTAYEYHSSGTPARIAAVAPTVTNERLRARIDGREDVYFVVSDHAGPEEVARMRDILGNDRGLTRVRHYTDVSVYVYARERSAASNRTAAPAGGDPSPPQQ